MNQDSKLIAEAYSKIIKEAGEDLRPRDFGRPYQHIEDEIQRDLNQLSIYVTDMLNNGISKEEILSKVSEIITSFQTQDELAGPEDDEEGMGPTNLGGDRGPTTEY